MSKRYKKLRDGLTQDIIERDHKWLHDADITNADVGLNQSGEIVWHGGCFDGGTFKGVWINGNWIEGEWDGVRWYKGDVLVSIVDYVAGCKIDFTDCIFSEIPPDDNFYDLLDKKFELEIHRFMANMTSLRSEFEWHTEEAKQDGFTYTIKTLKPCNQ
jgi:hypothetical protein